MDPPEPPLCADCGEVAEPGSDCPGCGAHQLDQADIDEARAEAAIARIEDARMFPEPDDDWEPSC